MTDDTQPPKVAAPVDATCKHGRPLHRDCYICDETKCDHVMIEEREREGCIKCGAFAWPKDPDSREPKATALELADMALKAGYSLKPNGDWNEAVRIIAQAIEYYADPALQEPKAMREASELVKDLAGKIIEAVLVRVDKDTAMIDIRAITDVEFILKDVLQSKGCALPEGWVAVPKEPTIQMLWAMDYAGSTEQQAYTAMIAVAPQPPKD